ncbi:MAG: hypothetical protein LUF28_09440 [Clostridiales bacterium]|nr:hypothetical protein [Clostridiales bacterium]
MKFQQLNAAIRNNAEREPTIYMALCMVDSLFRDIRDESGTFIYNCPVGDETLPTKLAWLCRIINQIYDKNKDELERDRARLDKMMQQLAGTEQKLDELSGIYEELSKAQEKLNAAKAELARRQEARKTCQTLDDECRQVGQEIERLRQYDPEKSQETLDRLRAEAAELTQTQTDLTRACIEQESKNQPLRAKVAGLASDIQKLEQEKAERAGKVTALQGSLDKLNAEISQLKEREPRLREEIDQAQAERDSRQQSVQDAQTKLDRLNAKKADLDGQISAQNEVIATVNAEIADLRAHLEALQNQLLEKEQEKQAEDDHAATLQSDKRKIEADIEQFKMQYETLQQEYETLIITCERKKNDIAAQQAQTADYRVKELAPVEAQLQEATDEYDQVLQQKTAKEQILTELRTKRSNAVVEIALINDEIEAETVKLHIKDEERTGRAQKRDALKEQVRQLETTLTALTDELGALQTRVNNLQDQDIPDMNADLQAEEKRKQEQEQALETLTRKKAEIEAENEKRKHELAELEADVNEKNAAYQELTARYETNTAELKSLRRRLSELQDKTDAEKLNIYHQQLNDEIAKLEKIRQETREAEALLETGQAELQSAEQERNDKKRQLEELNKKTQEIDAEITALTPMTAPELRQRVADASQRLLTLEDTRKALAAAIRTLGNALGQSEAEKSDLNRLEADLDALRTSMEQIQQELLICAEKCKNRLNWRTMK